MKKRIISVVGARPQFIKAAAFSNALKNSDLIEEMIIHTGQHYDPSMSQVFFDGLGIPAPKWNLSVGSSDHGQQTGRMLEGIEQILKEHKPDAVNVYGDTNSTLAGALAAAKLHIPVIHIESGLRSFDQKMPEEINRVLTDHISSLLFCPSQQSKDNLLKEGISGDKIKVVGDIMYEICLQSAAQLGSKFNSERARILVTIHRSENTDDVVKLERIAKDLISLSKKYKIFFPIHPRTLKLLNLNPELLNNLKNSISLVEPMDHSRLIEEVVKSEFVITDSGGLQKEAYFLERITLLIRDRSEWQELVDTNWVQLAPPIDNGFLEKALENIKRPNSSSKHIYGDGMTSKKILIEVEKFLKNP